MSLALTIVGLAVLLVHSYKIHVPAVHRRHPAVAAVGPTHRTSLELLAGRAAHGALTTVRRASSVDDPGDDDVMAEVLSVEDEIRRVIGVFMAAEGGISAVDPTLLTDNAHLLAKGRSYEAVIAEVIRGCANSKEVAKVLLQRTAYMHAPSSTRHQPHCLRVCACVLLLSATGRGHRRLPRRVRGLGAEATRAVEAQLRDRGRVDQPPRPVHPLARRQRRNRRQLAGLHRQVRGYRPKNRRVPREAHPHPHPHPICSMIKKEILRAVGPAATDDAVDTLQVPSPLYCPPCDSDGPSLSLVDTLLQGPSRETIEVLRMIRRRLEAEMTMSGRMEVGECVGVVCRGSV